jgi:ABC-type uncharacterized transport system involved in gliding motility auxiliary subunit
MANRIFGIIGWLGVACVFGAVAIRFGMPAQEQYATYLAEAALICMVLYIGSQWREILGFFGSRQAQYGTLAASSVFIVLGILIAVNYIGKRQNKRWDLTAAKQFSLSDQSRNVLSKLDAPLEVRVFARETDFQTYRDRLKEYEYGSPQLKAEYIDPDKRRALAEQNQITEYGTLVLTYKGRTERVTGNSEQDITNGIIKVVSGQQRKIYFTTGHGEKDTASQEPGGYGTIASSLTRENYAVDKLVLAQAGSVPDDASAVIVAGPRTDFFPPEIDALRKYLERNGKLLVLIDPAADGTAPPPANLIALLHDWAIDVGNGFVVDASGMGRLIGADATAPIAASYPSHPITERFQILTAYPMTRPVAPVPGGVNGRTAVTFVESSARSWAETDFQTMLKEGKVELNEDRGDKPGPVSMAAAVSVPSTSPAAPDASEADAPKPEARVAVFGDSDFASNGVLGIQGNRDLFMNTVGWLSQQENLISIRPKEADDRRITLTATQQNNITWLSLLIIPGLVFGSGIYAWWQRR